MSSEEMLASLGPGDSAILLAETVPSHLSDLEQTELQTVAIALAARIQDRPLIERLNSTLTVDALTVHRRVNYHGDLDEVLKRRVIRVGMLNNSVAYFLHRGQEYGFQFDSPLL